MWILCSVTLFIEYILCVVVFEVALKILNQGIEQSSVTNVADDLT
jgi:hypothetical protein